MTEIISLAERHLQNLEMDDQSSELRFLFWAYTFGLERTRGALQSNPIYAEKQRV